jgi:DNA-binding HxlR family transcriptional regulator
VVAHFLDHPDIAAKAAAVGFGAAEDRADDGDDIGRVIGAHVRERPHHFAKLCKALLGVSAKVLNEQLRHLEADRLILRREAWRQGVRHVYYDDSGHGRTLVPALDVLGDRGQVHQVGAG